MIIPLNELHFFQVLYGITLEISIIIFRCVILCLDFILTCVELRFCLSWFLNINPYFEPFLTLWAFTHPFMWAGRNLYPRFLGLNMTAIVNYRIIGFTRSKCEELLLFQQSTLTTLDEPNLPQPLKELDEFTDALLQTIDQSLFSPEVLQTSLIDIVENVFSNQTNSILDLTPHFLVGEINIHHLDVNIILNLIN